MCNDIGSASQCCFFYSIAGMIFTAWVGILIKTQPFFINGLEDVEEAGTSAFGAMFMFICTLILSLVGKFYDATRKKDEIDDVDAYQMEGYQLNTGEVPAYGTTG